MFSPYFHGWFACCLITVFVVKFCCSELDKEILFNDTFIRETVPYLVTSTQEYTINFTDDYTASNWLINSNEFNSATSVVWEIWDTTDGNFLLRRPSQFIVINVCPVF